MHTVVTSAEGADIAAWEFVELAAQLGVGRRRLEEWRARGLIPRPTLAGYEGKRPRWVYPADSAKQLRAVVRLRQNTRDLDAIRVMLWVQGFSIPVDAVRSSLLVVLRRFEEAMVRDVARFAPADIGPERLRENPVVLQRALEAYADDAARQRSRFPIKRHVRMSLAERQRGILYILAPFFDQPREEQDAILAERVYGISRGRSGTAQGRLELPPDELSPRNPLTPEALQAGVEAADELTFVFVGEMLKSFLTLLPALLPIFVPAESTLRQFADDAMSLFKDPHPYAIALLAAAFITNTHRQRAEIELTEDIVHNAQLPNLFREIYGMLSPEQQQQLTGGQRTS
jgi:hypothetical protein